MRIAVVGLGLIGGSLAKALKENTAHEVIGFDTNEDVLLDARALGAIDRVGTPALLETTDVVYVCLYPQDVVRFLTENGARFSPRCIVTDTCGVKMAVCAACAVIARENDFIYIGGHPMAGKEQSGFAASEAGLFRGASYILTPEGAPEDAVSALESLARQMGFGTIQICTPAHHDRMIAFTSQVPHVLACAYVMSPACDTHAGFSAGSYRDVSRVASINAALWADLFLANDGALSAELSELLRNIQKIQAAVDKGDRDGLVELLRAAAGKKERFG